MNKKEIAEVREKTIKEIIELIQDDKDISKLLDKREPSLNEGELSQEVKEQFWKSVGSLDYYLGEFLELSRNEKDTKRKIIYSAIVSKLYLLRKSLFKTIKVSLKMSKISIFDNLDYDVDDLENFSIEQKELFKKMLKELKKNGK